MQFQTAGLFLETGSNDTVAKQEQSQDLNTT